MPLRVTLVSDGSSDRVLLPVIRWLITQKLPDVPLQDEWADLARLKNPPRNLAGKIVGGIVYYKCDLLFVHRDAEADSYEARKSEIEAALDEARRILDEVDTAVLMPQAVFVIPVRMSEAWLLFDEKGIREAAGNPNSRIPLDLPRLGQLEGMPSPKNYLYQLLREASGLSGRGLKKFKPQVSAHILADRIEDFSPLRALPAFQRLEDELDDVLRNLEPDIMEMV